MSSPIASVDPLHWRLFLGIVGLFVCFFGYSTFRFALSLTGFAIGAYAVFLRSDLLPKDPPWLAPALIVAAGIVTMIVILTAYRLGIFLIGAIAFVLLIQALHVPLPFEPAGRLIALALAGIVGGLLSRFVERFVLVVLTAAYGAFMIVSAVRGGGPALPPSPSLHSPDLSNVPVAVIAWAVLAVAGVLAQLSRSRKKRVPAEGAIKA